ncbi:MAG: hypothetical protein CVU08_07185 [Bacteroidetes bacterium HGW-Bacteroidetes-3]|jgi:DNA replication protein DnaC|nr:MAG: hypothetical protein CVU08_07185 [Bacteroidetes bacterium HGW-Bacteroidetes-3]
MGEILLSRYDVFKKSMEVAEGAEAKTHITTNLNAYELETHYGGRIRSRLREMFNLISFDHSSADKRKQHKC